MKVIKDDYDLERPTTPTVSPQPELIGEGSLRTLWAFASANAPKESCGIIAGLSREDETFHVVMELLNISPKPTEEFEFNPTSFYPALAQWDGFKRVGLWHSHPGGRSEPSRQDYHLMRLVALPMPMAIVGWKPEPCVSLYDFTENGRMIRRVWYGRIPS